MVFSHLVSRYLKVPKRNEGGECGEISIRAGMERCNVGSLRCPPSLQRMETHIDIMLLFGYALLQTGSRDNLSTDFSTSEHERIKKGSGFHGNI